VPRDQWRAPNRVGKASIGPVSSQALLLKIVTKILFGQCTFSKNHLTTVLAADHRPAHSKERDLITIFNKSKHGYIHARIHKSTRPAQHMSCTPGQVLHLWRAHSPPKPSLMRRLIQSSEVRLHPEAWLHDAEWITRALPREKYSAAQLDVEMLYPPVLSVTNDCARHTIDPKTVPRGANLCSAAHVTHTGAPWDSLENPMSTNNQSIQCLLSGYWGEAQLLIDNAPASTSHTGLHWHRQKVHT